MRAVAVFATVCAILALPGCSGGVSRPGVEMTLTNASVIAGAVAAALTAHDNAVAASQSR